MNYHRIFQSSLFLSICCICLCVITPGTAIPAEDNTFTDADAKELKSDDPDTVADVLYKLADINETDGNTPPKEDQADESSSSDESDMLKKLMERRKQELGT